MLLSTVPHYDLLYLVENLAFLVVLGILAWNARGAWKEIYRNLFVASGLYAVSSLALNAAIARGQYYTGSIYDIPFIASVCWMIWATLAGAGIEAAFASPRRSELSRWQMLAPRLAMLAMLSLPLMGYWAWFRDTSPPNLRQFRLLVTLAAMLVLGLFVFLRQFLMDRELVRLLEESRSSLENMKRLQTELVQREKLASLAQLVSGAAHEINNPLAAILGYSELLAAQAGLESEQANMARKIGQQARRTRELVVQPAQLCPAVARRKDAAGYGIDRTTRPANENAAHGKQEAFIWRAGLLPGCRKSGATSISSSSAAWRLSGTRRTLWKKWAAGRFR